MRAANCMPAVIITWILFAAMIKKRKKPIESDQRRWPRLNPEEVPFLKNLQLNQGKEAQAQIINISQGGILFETTVRLRPNLRILLKIVTTKGIFQMSGLVLRSSISSLQGAPRFRSAVAFERPFEMLEEVQKTLIKHAQEALPEMMGSTLSAESDDAQSQAPASQKAEERSPAVLTIIAADQYGGGSIEGFQHNDW